MIAGIGRPTQPMFFADGTKDIGLIKKWFRNLYVNVGVPGLRDDAMRKIDRLS
jgi:hypothetical protein